MIKNITTYQEAVDKMIEKIVRHLDTHGRQRLRHMGFVDAGHARTYYKRSLEAVRPTYIELFGWFDYVNNIWSEYSDDVMSFDDFTNLTGHEDYFYFKDRLVFQVLFSDQMEYTVDAYEMKNSIVNAYSYFHHVLGREDKLHEPYIFLGIPNITLHGIGGMDKIYQHYGVSVENGEPNFEIVQTGGIER